LRRAPQRAELPCESSPPSTDPGASTRRAEAQLSQHRLRRASQRAELPCESSPPSTDAPLRRYAVLLRRSLRTAYDAPSSPWGSSLLSIDPGASTRRAEAKIPQHRVPRVGAPDEPRASAGVSLD